MLPGEIIDVFLAYYNMAAIRIHDGTEWTTYATVAWGLAPRIAAAVQATHPAWVVVVRPAVD